jgi:PEP-CTERM motif
MTKRTTFLAYAAILALGAISAPSAQAKFVAVFEEVGSNVVETGAGTLDLSDLSLAPFFPTLNEPEVIPNIGFFNAGTVGLEGNMYFSTPGPDSFGSAPATLANSSSGDFTGIGGGSGSGIVVPINYVFGDPLSNTSTYLNASFASLGMTPGEYVWSWGTGAHADTFTVIIGAGAVPEASTWAMMLIGFAGLGYAAVRRKGVLRTISA